MISVVESNYVLVEVVNSLFPPSINIKQNQEELSQQLSFKMLSFFVQFAIYP